MGELVTSPQNGRALAATGDPVELGKVLAASGYFADAKDAAQCAVKVMAGRELGFGPIASMTGVHIIEGKPSLGGPMLAALVKQHPRYRYKIVTHTEKRCAIEFFERFGDKWESCGPASVFTLEDAARAGLTGKHNWKRYPRNMLFWRALSAGVGMYCPDVTSGNRVYVPDEFDVDVDAEGQPLDPGALQPTPATTPVIDGEPVVDGENPEPDELPEHARTKRALELDAENEELMDALGFTERKKHVTWDAARTTQDKKTLNARLTQTLAEKQAAQ